MKMAAVAHLLFFLLILQTKTLRLTIISPTSFLKTIPNITKRSILGINHYNQNTRLKVRCLLDKNCELPDFIGLKLPQIKKPQQTTQNYLFNKL